MSNDQKNYKIIILGESFVGKTSIVTRFIDDIFDDSLTATIGIGLFKKQIDINNEKIKLNIWDTAGQERFYSITKSYYRNCHGILLVFDLSDIKSFNCIDRWFQGIEAEVNENVPIFLIGNKFDQMMEDSLTNLKMFEEKALEKNIRFFAVSAKTGENIENIFYELARECISNNLEEDFTENSVVFDENSKNTRKKLKKRCC